MVEQMLLGTKGELAPFISTKEPAHPHLHVGPMQTDLEKETLNRFKYLARDHQTTGYLYAHSGNWERLIKAFTRAFNSYIKSDCSACAFGGSSSSFTCVLDLSDFNIGRARTEEGSLDRNGARVTITRAEDVDAKNFFLKLVRPPRQPAGYLARAAIIQTTYPTDAEATVKPIRKG
ncbi:MAG: hypothetical protein ACK48Y_23130 [Planctomyces sp.]